MESVGSLLRSERERQGLQIARIAQTLCITQAYLKAIEADDLEQLPGTFFYKSFVKQYAELLHIPQDRIRVGIEALTAPATEPDLPKQGLPGDKRDNPPAESSTSWIGEVKHLLDSYNGGNVSPNSRKNAPIRMLDPVVESTNQQLSGHRLGASLAGLGAVLLFCSGFYMWWSHAPKTVPATAQSAAPAVSTQAVSTQTVAAAANPAHIDLTTSQSPDGRAVLNLSATDDVWISVIANGKEVFSGVLKPSQTKTLTGIEAAQMKVGNAGGLEAKWNGKPIGPIGPRGQVRTVVLTPENFEILPPKPVSDDAL